MATEPTRPRFEFVEDHQPTGEVLVCGFSEYGLAGLTAADYLVDQTTLDQCGHVRTVGLPTITPFEDGTPRHPIRLFDTPDLPTSILVSEVGVPVGLSQTFAESLLDWAGTADVDEVVIVSGVPVAHGPEDHRTFSVATADYQAAHFEDDHDVPGMANGFLDGVTASLLARGMESDLRVCVYVTPVHPQAPDIEASLRLLETLTGVYEIPVDTGPLESFAAEVQNHYAELADRLERLDDEQAPEDRMYM